MKYAQERAPFGKPLASNQAIQFPLVELHTECEMIRNLVYKTAWQMDQMSKKEVAIYLSDKVSMCNYRANRLVCDAADRAMQVHGGIGYSRHKPFEHIYRHHRRYRITEGSEEIQIRRSPGCSSASSIPTKRAPRGAGQEENSVSYERIKLDYEGNIAVLTFNHPEVMNAVCTRMLTELQEAVQEVRDQGPEVRCLLMTGEGRGFCAGANLADEEAQRAEEKQGAGMGFAPAIIRCCSARGILSFPSSPP